MEQIIRSFSRSTLFAAAALAVSMIMGSPTTGACADHLDTSILAPLPDLRTPDQVGWLERLRNRRLAQTKIHAAKAEARLEAIKQKGRATVSRPAQDPSTAAAVVESQAGSPPAITGAAPETIDGKALKPFNRQSKFYQGGSLVSQGKNRVRSR